MKLVDFKIQKIFSLNKKEEKKTLSPMGIYNNLLKI